MSQVAVGTDEGAPVEDVRVTAPDGTTVRLRDRLGQGRLLVLLVAPGTGVWDRRHWMSAGVMPRLVEAVRALPVKAELLVTEAYPAAAAHTVLLVRPDGHLVASFPGVRPEELYAAADATRGGKAAEPEPRRIPPKAPPAAENTPASASGSGPGPGPVAKPASKAIPEPVAKSVSKSVSKKSDRTADIN